MSLHPGTPLGPYQIVAPLGAGGMGKVYCAPAKTTARRGAINALRGRVLPEAHPMVAATMQVEGLSLMDLGQASEAEPLFRESSELRRQSLPPGH